MLFKNLKVFFKISNNLGTAPKYYCNRHLKAFIFYAILSFRNRLQTIAYFKMFKFLTVLNLYVIKLSE